MIWILKVDNLKSYQQKEYRYYFDKVISPWLNIRNKQGMISDFTIKDTDTVSFNVHSSQVEGLLFSVDELIWRVSRNLSASLQVNLGYQT